MPAYVIIALDIKDRAKYDKYSAPAGASLAPYGVKILAADDTPESLEGTLPAQRIILLEFANSEDAKSWYSSEEYSEAKPIRLDATETAFLFVAKGLE